MSSISLASNVYLGGNASQVFSGNNRLWRRLPTVKDFWTQLAQNSNSSWLAYVGIDGICRIQATQNTYGQATLPAAFQGVGAVRKCESTQGPISYVLGTNNICQFFGRNIASYGAINKFPASLVNSPTLQDVAINYVPWDAAALRVNGSVISWGTVKTGTWYADNDAINSDSRLASGVTKIQWAGMQTLVALKTDGSLVVIAGNPTSPDVFRFDSPLTTDTHTGIRDIVGGKQEDYFAKIDNQNIVTIYERVNGTDPFRIIRDCPTEFLNPGSTLSSMDITYGMAIALRSDGSVVTWGTLSRQQENGVDIDPAPKHVYLPRPGGATGAKVTCWAGIGYLGLPNGSGNYEVTQWNTIDKTTGRDLMLLGRDYEGKYTPYDINTGYWVRNAFGVTWDANFSVSVAQDVKFSTYAKRFVCPTLGRGPQGYSTKINGWPVMEYNNSNQFLTAQFNGVESSILLRPTGDSYQAESLVFMAKKAVVDSINAVWIQDNTASPRAIFNTPDNTLFVDYGTKVSNGSAHRLTVSNIWPNRNNTTSHIFVITLNAAPAQGEPSIAVWRDGSLIGSLNLAEPITVLAGNTTILGNNGGFANSFCALLAEFISFGYILPATDRQKIEGYLAWKYATASQLPEDHPYKQNVPLRVE